MRVARTALQRLHRPRSGATAAELALVLPLLAFLAVAILDFSRLFHTTISVTNCARNGALWASDPGNQSQSPYTNVTAAIQASDSNVSLDSCTYAPSITGGWGSYNSTTSNYVKVTVYRDITTTLTYPGVANPMRVSHTVYMRILPQ
jgi:Flp pilus assembly protein TadG